MALALRDQDIQKYRLPQEDEGMSERSKYLTVIVSDPTKEEASALIGHPKMSASSWSHAINDRDAKDAEIADLRQRIEIFQLGEAAALGMLGAATTERDEARECVKRLAQGLRNAASNSYGPDRAEALAVLAATPEHLR